MILVAVASRQCARIFLHVAASEHGPRESCQGRAQGVVQSLTYVVGSSPKGAANLYRVVRMQDSISTIQLIAVINLNTTSPEIHVGAISIHFSLCI